MTVGEVRVAVLKAMGGYLERHWPDNPVNYDDMADYIASAITPRQAVPDGWKAVPAEPTLEIISAAAAAAWPTASPADVAMAIKATRIVLESNMEAGGGASLDQIEAAITTIAPAYRAMVAPAPEVPRG